MRKEIQRHESQEQSWKGGGAGGGGCLIKSVIQAAAEADGIAHVRQTPSYTNVPEQNGLERKCVGPGRNRLLREGRMWTKGNSSAPGTEEQRNFVSLFLEVFEQLMLLLCEVGD